MREQTSSPELQAAQVDALKRFREAMMKDATAGVDPERRRSAREVSELDLAIKECKTLGLDPSTSVEMQRIKQEARETYEQRQGK